jgi:hypothetical protein
MISASQTPPTCELSALWAVAWLEDLFWRTPMPLVDGVDVGNSKLTVPSSTPVPFHTKSNGVDCRDQGPDPKHDTQTLKDLADAEIRLVQAWQARRYGVRGATKPLIILEIQSFLDVLCRDLGLEWRRKRMPHQRAKKSDLSGMIVSSSPRWPWTGSLWDCLREYLEPYRASDYKGVVEEFLQSRETHVHTQMGREREIRSGGRR